MSKAQLIHKKGPPSCTNPLGLDFLFHLSNSSYGLFDRQPRKWPWMIVKISPSP